MLAYAVALEPQEDGTVLVTSPDFPELTSWGEDDEDALLHAVDAFEEAIAARIANRRDLPAASPAAPSLHPVALPTQTTLKAQIYRRMRELGVSKAELARRLHWHGPQVDRLLDLNHASRLEHLDAAAAALQARVVAELEPAA